jgi:hypothetical protein
MYPVLSANTPATTSYNLTKSLRFRSAATAYLNRTQATATNGYLWTWSAWVKRGSLGTSQGLFGASLSGISEAIQFVSSDALEIYNFNGSAYIWQIDTTQVFRDPSAWYHIVVSVDGTQSTASNRVKLYVNGTQVIAFSTASYPAQNTQYQVNQNTAVANIGKYPAGSSGYFDGYMAEQYFIDGQALTPSSFGSTNSTTGVWQPARYTGTYGTNGFYLPFTNTTSTITLGYDSSGNGNNWTTNNFSLTTGSTYDSMTDVPTLTSATVANYAVCNPLGNTIGTTSTLSNGNLTASASGNTWWNSTISLPSSGKWYFEYIPTGVSANAPWIGISSNSTDYSFYQSSGAIYINGSSITTVATYTNNDVIACAYDVSGTIYFYKNNTLVYSGALTYKNNMFFTGFVTTGNAVSMNFGQQGFTYTPPTGYVALNTYNLPTSTIVKGNTVMDATTYTGTGSNPITVTNTASFKPDLVWGKIRSQTYNNQLYDSVRGTGKSISSNSTGQTITNETDGYITSFNSNGFTAGAGATSNNYWNQNTQTYVAWQWQAGQGTTSSNTNGSITSTVSVNPNAGFSIVQYVGTGANATVGHGLGVAPSMVIVKSLTRTDNWIVYHSGMTSAAYYMYLNQTNAQAIGTTVWNSTAPTSSVFSLGIDTTANSNGATQIAYCWAEIAGFSKFGSYTGNGSTDGAFIYTGFRPKYLMFKRTDTGGAGFDWYIVDTVRNTYNASGTSLWANLSDAEISGTFIDILSNGFKFRGTSTGYNGSGATYIYSAFAENPFKNALAR